MTSWQIFWCDDVFLTSWWTLFWSNNEPFVLMTYFDIITNILKSGQTDFLKSWWVYDIITNLWRHNKHDVSNIFDVMEVFDDVTHYLMPWHTFWRHDELFNVMVCSLLGGEFCVVMTYFMTCLHCPDIFYFIILGTKYYENVFLMSLSLWYIIYFMVNVWRHDKPNVIMPCCWWTFWRHRMFLTSWRTFLTHLLTSWRVFDVIAHLSMSWHVFDFMTNLLTSRRVFDVIDVFWRVCDIMTNFL